MKVIGAHRLLISKSAMLGGNFSAVEVKVNLEVSRRVPALMESTDQRRVR